MAPTPSAPEARAPEGTLANQAPIVETMSPVLANSPFGLYLGGVTWHEVEGANNRLEDVSLYLPHILVELQRCVKLNDTAGFAAYLAAINVEVFSRCTHHRTAQTKTYMDHCAAIRADVQWLLAEDVHWREFAALLCLIRTHSTSIALARDRKNVHAWTTVVASASALGNEMAVLVADALCEAIDLGLEKIFDCTGDASTAPPVLGHWPRRTPANYIYATDKWLANASRWPHAATAPLYWTDYWEAFRAAPGGQARFEAERDRRRFIGKHPKRALWDGHAKHQTAGGSTPRSVDASGSRKREVLAPLRRKIYMDITSAPSLQVDRIDLLSVMRVVSTGAAAQTNLHDGEARREAWLKRVASSAAAYLVAIGFDVHAGLGEQIRARALNARGGAPLITGEQAALLFAHERLFPYDDDTFAGETPGAHQLYARFGPVPGFFCLLEELLPWKVKLGDPERIGDLRYHELRIHCVTHRDAPGERVHPDLLLGDPFGCTSLTQILSTVWLDHRPEHPPCPVPDRNAASKPPGVLAPPGTIQVELTQAQFEAMARVEWACRAMLLKLEQANDPSMRGPVARSIAERFRSRLTAPKHGAGQPPRLAVSVPVDTEVVVCEMRPDAAKGGLAGSMEISRAHHARLRSLLGMSSQGGLGEDLHRLRLGSVSDLRDGARVVPVLKAGPNAGVYVDASRECGGWCIQLELKHAIVINDAPAGAAPGRCAQHEQRRKRLRALRRAVGVVLLCRRWLASARAGARAPANRARSQVPGPIRRCCAKAIVAVFASARVGREQQAKEAEAEAQRAAERARKERESEIAAREAGLARVRKLNLESYHKFALKAKEREREAKEAAPRAARAARAAEKEANQREAAKAKAEAQAQHDAQVRARRQQRAREKAQRETAEQAAARAAQAAEAVRAEAEAKRARAEHAREREAALARVAAEAERESEKARHAEWLAREREAALARIAAEAERARAEHAREREAALARIAAEAERESEKARHAEWLRVDEPRREVSLRKLAQMENDALLVRRAHGRRALEGSHGWRLDAVECLLRACAAARKAEDDRLHLPVDASRATKQAQWEAVVRSHDQAVAEHHKIKHVAANTGAREPGVRKAALSAPARAERADATNHPSEQEDCALVAAERSAETLQGRCCKKLQEAISLMREAEGAHNAARLRPKHERDELYPLVELLRAEAATARVEYNEASSALARLREQRGEAAARRAGRPPSRAGRPPSRAASAVQATADLRHRLGISQPPTSPPAPLADLRHRLGISQPPTTHDTSCIICMDAPRDHAAIACGHQVVCGKCCAEITHCPVCRKKTAFLRLILS